MASVFNLVVGFMILFLVGAILHRLAAFIGSKCLFISKITEGIVNLIKKLCTHSA